jgi:uncharacterized protein (DUF1684 family)
VEEQRRLRDRFMATQPESPFNEENLPFRGLRYYPVDRTWRVPALYTAEEKPPEVWLRTSRDGHAAMRRLGTLSLTLRDVSVQLFLYYAGPQAGRVAFLPFRDLTSGKDTYGPGRYLNLELRTGRRYTIDFNEAFNPYCAYTPAYECPFPPPENDIPVAIEAGEKVYDETDNPASPEEAIRRLTLRFRERKASLTSGLPPSPPQSD